VLLATILDAARWADGAVEAPYCTQETLSALTNFHRTDISRSLASLCDGERDEAGQEIHKTILQVRNKLFVFVPPEEWDLRPRSLDVAMANRLRSAWQKSFSPQTEFVVVSDVPGMAHADPAGAAKDATRSRSSNAPGVISDAASKGVPPDRVCATREGMERPFFSTGPVMLGKSHTVSPNETGAPVVLGKSHTVSPNETGAPVVLGKSHTDEGVRGGLYNTEGVPFKVQSLKRCTPGEVQGRTQLSTLNYKGEPAGTIAAVPARARGAGLGRLPKIPERRADWTYHEIDDAQTVEEMLDCVFHMTDSRTLINWGGWYVNRWLENREKFLRIFKYVGLDVREGKVTKNPGGHFFDLWMNRIPD
jgi:hypothetical protein